MISDLRDAFNAAFTPEGYQRFLDDMARRCGEPVPFRCCETPCFLPRDLVDEMARVGAALAERLIADHAYRDAARARIPESHRVPRETERPLFVQADFGIDAAGEPKLVEIQGFPSLYAFQSALADAYRAAWALPDHLDPYLSGLDAAGYDRVVGGAICGDVDPAQTVLLELHPERQKTRGDFVLTERRYGVRTVCATTVRQRGRRLYAPDGVPIARVYNRIVVDELLRAGVVLPFDPRADLDVAWAGHPNWFYLISKFALPFLDHPCVPESRFLSDLSRLPDDLDQWVLKPLFGFAGEGVTVGPTRAQVAAVADPQNWILQRRIAFAPTIATPEGPTRVEVRVMFVDTDSGLRPVTTLLRMGRGTRIGVDQNRDAAWVGASAGFLAV